MANSLHLYFQDFKTKGDFKFMQKNALENRVFVGKSGKNQMEWTTTPPTPDEIEAFNASMNAKPPPEKPSLSEHAKNEGLEGEKDAGKIWNKLFLPEVLHK